MPTTTISQEKEEHINVHMSALGGFVFQVTVTHVSNEILALHKLSMGTYVLKVRLSVKFHTRTRHARVLRTICGFRTSYF